MLFSGWEWHITNKESSDVIKNMSLFLHQWRMPLLFFISGAGTFFALGYRKPKEFVVERTKRLLIPLLAGIFLVVSPQVYIERIKNYSSYLDFYPHFFDGIYPKGNFSWHHLWFVAYLLVYSLVSLPLFLKLRNPNSQKIVNFFKRILTSWYGSFLLVLPIVLSQFILRPFFPNDTHALVDDWACFVYYLFFFLYGYIISVSDDWTSLEKYKKHNLCYSILSFIFLFVGYAFFFDNPNYHIYTRKAIQIAIQSLTAWFCVITIIGYGIKFLNKSNKFLPYANEGIYPFYILHQTAIVLIGYFVIQWKINLYVKYLIISNLSLVVCIFIYWFFIRPFGITRVLFGMKN